jgi:nickel-dependent lactate racemase
MKFTLPEDATIESISPAVSPARETEESIEAANAEVQFLANSISGGLERVSERMAACKNVLIACEDNTRVAPVKFLLPAVIDAVRAAGKEASLIVAGGSHRRMTDDEKLEKFGQDVLDALPVIDHAWDDPGAFTSFGTAAGGYDIMLNTIACDPDTFVIGMGNIVPHRVCGFSGGYKILLPGLTCQETINHIHYLSAQLRSEKILGVARNPVRDAINEIGRFRPIDFLINTVLDGTGNIVSLCTGDPIEAQYQGSVVAKQVYGVPVGKPADLVITDAVPEVLDFWVCAKALTNTKSFVKQGGHLVAFTPCTEGLSPAHGEVLLRYGYRPPAEIDAMVNDVTIDEAHLLEASHLSHIGEILQHCHVHLVSDTLDMDTLGQFGFDVVQTCNLDALVDEIFSDLRSSVQGRKIRAKLVSHGSEILPVVG